MNIVFKSLIVRWSFALLLALVCNGTAIAHGYGGGYWRPHAYSGWQRPYYPPAPVYVPGPRYVPPPFVYGAPPVYLRPPLPIWGYPHRHGWR